MKKSLILLTAAIVLPLALTACTGNTVSGESKEQVETDSLSGTDAAPEMTFQAKVIEAENGTLLVEPTEDSSVRRSADLISAGIAQMPSSPEPQPGDIVEIACNGDILESYPAQLGEVYSIRIIRQAEAGTDTDEDKESTETVASYAYEDLYLSVTLPEGWEYTVKTVEEMEKTDGLMTCAIDFYPAAFPETVFELGYCQQFGICATGVTIEDIALSGGLTGHQYTETSDNTIWLTIAFDRPDSTKTDGTYLITGSPELSVWEQIEPEFELILDTVRVGSGGDLS